MNFPPPAPSSHHSPSVISNFFPKKTMLEFPKREKKTSVASSFSGTRDFNPDR